MSLKTSTYNDEEWQLVPRVLKYQVRLALCHTLCVDCVRGAPKLAEAWKLALEEARKLEEERPNVA